MRPHRLALLLALVIATAAAVVVDSKAVGSMEWNYQSNKDALVRDGNSVSLFELFPSHRLGWAGVKAAGCTPGTKLSHSAAWSMVSAVGINIRSSTGRIGCRDVGCTSLEQVRCDTVLGIIAFKKACGCSNVVITGGTEKGHASGTYSHYNGYKLDIALDSCITNYIKANFRYSGKRSDGADMYTDGRGNIYALENNHWDILYTK